MIRIPHWIDGAERPEGVADLPVFDPAQGVETARVPSGDRTTVAHAVASAVAAFPVWRETSLAHRSAILFRFRQLLADRAEKLAQAVVRENGKVLEDARGEVRRGLDVVEFACGVPHLLRGGFTENVSSGIDTYSLRQPLGVVAGITPFNFPVMVPLWMVPLAVACGNAFVLKPSEKDPSPALLLARWFSEAGLPPGVLNVIHGAHLASTALLEHPDVRAVSFVGSSPVARFVYETATRHGKRVQALAGAKNHMVVMPDADLDTAAGAAVSAAYGSAGERCMAISVVVAVAEVAEPLVRRIADRAGRIVVGNGLDPKSQMGPLVTAEHRDRVAAYVGRGAAEGAAIVLDGRRSARPNGDQGFFLGPCLLDRVTPAMAVYRDEIFGPVLSVVRVGTFEEARDLINANPFANGVAVFTGSGAVARRFQHEIEVGMVGINLPIPVPVAYYSFGGWKASLFGDTHVYGEDGVRFYTRTKVVTARWGTEERGRGTDLGFPVAD